MASRSTIKASIRRMLAVESDDPAFDDDVLNPLVQEACDSLVTDINVQNPDYNATTVTLSADSSTARTYTFATQSSPVTDFSRWREVRWTDESGLELHEADWDTLREAGADHFVITGIDSAAVLRTSSSSEAGRDVWLKYTQWPVELSGDSSVPGGIPLRFHDVIALEALYAFGLGGEQRLPPELFSRWQDRRNQLMHHVGKRGSQPSRTRVYGVAL